MARPLVKTTDERKQAIITFVLVLHVLLVVTENIIPVDSMPNEARDNPE